MGLGEGNEKRKESNSSVGNLAHFAMIIHYINRTCGVWCGGVVVLGSASQVMIENVSCSLWRAYSAANLVTVSCMSRSRSRLRFVSLLRGDRPKLMALLISLFVAASSDVDLRGIHTPVWQPRTICAARKDRKVA